MEKSDLQQHLQDGLAELRTMRDEIRVRMHLAGMEVKERWKTLEPQVEDIEREMREAAGAATEQLRTSLDDLRESFAKLRAKL